MCGIIGILSLHPSKLFIPELVSGLKKLEYRGYDSWGYGAVDKDILKIEKKAGRVAIPALSFETSLGISHTRWATHGSVTDANAHPHTDCKGEIAIVHNGIIENYLELKEMLVKKGHKFKSQTDSEVIAHLLEDVEGTLLERVAKTAKILKGSFALVVLDVKKSKELVAVRNESPLVAGICPEQVIFASDPLAFLDKTTEGIFISDGEAVRAYVAGNSLKLDFVDFRSNMPISKQPVTLNWKAEESSLGNYQHYMLKEIMEQPAAMRKGTNQNSAIAMATAMKDKKVIAIGCGTARHAAVVGKHILQKIAGFSMEVMMAHEFSYFIDGIPTDTIILAVSQSGETADVMECVRKAKEKRMRVLSIVNVPSSTLARESEIAFYINCGPEIAVASTKAFTNQLVAFYLIAFALANQLSRGIKMIERAVEELEKKLTYFDRKANEISNYLKEKQHVYMLGRGVNFPIALEGALKLKEISYIHAEGMPAGELKHGTLALIEDGTPVFLLAPDDYTHHDSISNGLETKARGAYIIGISDKAHPSFNYWIELPDLRKDDMQILYPIIETIPLQLIAYYTAVALGRDVDKPRNLAKSVTVK